MLMGCHGITQAFPGLAGVHVHNWCSISVSWMDRSVDQSIRRLHQGETQDSPAMLVSALLSKWRVMWVRGGKVRNNRQELQGCSVGLQWGNSFLYLGLRKSWLLPSAFYIFSSAAVPDVWKAGGWSTASKFNEESDSFTLNHCLVQLFQ